MRISDWSSDVCSSDLSPSGSAPASAARCATTYSNCYSLGSQTRSCIALSSTIRSRDDGEVDIGEILLVVVDDIIRHLALAFALIRSAGVEIADELRDVGRGDLDPDAMPDAEGDAGRDRRRLEGIDRKSTRLNSSH